MKKPDILKNNNLRCVNEVLIYSTISSPSTSFETGFIDLLEIHNIYIHTIIKQVPFSSSFGYLIMDSVVAPHGKIDVSRQLF